MPASSRWRATLSAPRLVRVKTMVRVSSGLANSSTSSDALGLGVDQVDVLADALDRGGGRRHRNFDRVLQHLGGELADLLRHGGREEQRLPLHGDLRDDAPDRLDEAHVEHLVGLVEHQGLDAFERHVATVQVVEQAAGRGDQHVDAARQRLDLRAVADAAIDGGDLDAEIASVGAEAVADLAAQLTRGAQHEHAAAAPHRLALVGGEAVQDRQREGGRLAGAGLGDALQVPAFEHARDGLDLDRRRRRVALLLEGLEDGRIQVEVREGLQVVLSFNANHTRQGAPDKAGSARMTRAAGQSGRPAWPGLSCGKI